MQTENVIIHIDWDGPYSLDAVSKLSGTKDRGVYQIYGAHPVYGSSVLLYIGRTSETFASRVPTHKLYRNNPDAERVEVYVGRLFGISTPKDWFRQIQLAEALLVYANQPADNVQRELRTLEPELQRVHVLNWHRYRDLLPEVSGACWTERFSDVRNYRHFDITDLGQCAPPIVST